MATADVIELNCNTQDNLNAIWDTNIADGMK